MQINYNEVAFDRSYGTVAQLPASLFREVSFAGRSNVGKSSLINKLFGRKGLAKVSSTPGKTATINFFNAGKVQFVDLPGYGFAQVSKAEKDRWSKLIDGYFKQDRRFALVCCLVDIRHDASPLDIAMIDFLRGLELPYAIVFTKADKVSAGKASAQRNLLKVQLGLDENVQTVVTSSEKGTGIKELRQIINAACDN